MIIQYMETRRELANEAKITRTTKTVNIYDSYRSGGLNPLEEGLKDLKLRLNKFIRLEYPPLKD